MIKAVLFDFDGTLVNTLPYYLEAYDKALKQIGFNIEKKNIAEICFGKKELDVCKSLGVPEKTEQFANAYFLAVKDSSKKAPLFSDSIEILKYLRSKNIKTVIITFAYRWYIDGMINHHNLNKYIDLVISQNDVKQSKPNQEAILKVTDIFKIQPNETLVVGDSKSDILMGKNAGSKTALFTKKEYDLFYSFDDLKKTNPDYIIEELSELKNKL